MTVGDNFMDLNSQNIFHEAVHSSVRSSGSLVDADNFVEKKASFCISRSDCFSVIKNRIHLQNLVLVSFRLFLSNC